MQIISEESQKQRNSFLKYARTFAFFFAIFLVVGTCTFLFTSRTEQKTLAKAFADEFAIDAKSLLMHDEIIDLSDSLSKNRLKELFSISNLYLSFGLFEWNDQWIPIYLDAPTLASPPFDADDFARNFYFEDGIYLWEGNKQSVLTAKNNMFAGIRRRGRLFLLGVEIDETYTQIYLRNWRGFIGRALLFILFFSAIFALICSMIVEHLSISYRKHLSHIIDIGEHYYPESLLPGIGEIGRLAILYARESAEARKDKRAAMLQAKNEFEKERADFALIREIIENASMATDLPSAVESCLIPILRRTSIRCGIVFRIGSKGDLTMLGERNITPDLAEEIRQLKSIKPAERVSKELTLLPIESVFDLESNPLKSLNKEGLTHCAIVPLVYGNSLWGVIHLYTHGKPKLSDRDMTILNTISTQIPLILENKRLLSDLEMEAKSGYKFYEISKLLISTSDLDMLIENILWIVHEALNAQYCSVLLVDDDTESVVVKGSWGYERERTNLRIPLGKGITGWVAQNGRALNIPDVHLDPRYIEGTENIRSEIAVPLILDEKIIGVIDCESEIENDFDERDLHFLNILAELSAMAIRRTTIQSEQAYKLIRDPVTSLFNQLYFDDYIKNNGEELLLRHGRISIAIVDVTNIKRIIKEYGRAAGNLVLKQTAEMLNELFPEGVVARYIGGEFMILLPGVGEDAMNKLIANLQERREKWSEEHPEAIPLSFTAGFATATRYDQLKSLLEATAKRAEVEQDIIDGKID